MAYEPRALEIALAAAVGDDPVLVADLRRAFIESAGQHVDAMNRASTAADWQNAAHRLQGLAASFGATGLMTTAERASVQPARDPGALRLLDRAFSRLQD